MDGLYGAVEAGGTKFVCMVGTGPDDMREQTRFPTTSPDATLRETIAFFRSAESTLGKVAAVGIASFGPVDVQSASPTFGFITSTPKAGWANVDIAGALRNAFDVPIGFDTDVNAAALAEWRWGAAQALDTFLYLTIGTGIGGGGMVNGRLMHGLVHPEMGHVRIPHDLETDRFRRHLSVSRRLPRGPGQRSGDGRAMVAACRAASVRPSRMDARGALPRPRAGELHLHGLTRTHRHGRWRDVERPALSGNPSARPRAVEQLRACAAVAAGHRRLYRRAMAGCPCGSSRCVGAGATRPRGFESSDPVMLQQACTAAPGVRVARDLPVIVILPRRPS